MTLSKCSILRVWPGKPMGFRLSAIIVTAFLLSFCGAVLAEPDLQGQGLPALPDDLTDMSLEQLMDIEVTSVSKRPQKISQAAAAIFVITRENIRQWGVTNIPEALRMVPGLQVARIDSNKWAITSRGFNSRFANKLLVLMDGRSVYTPLFAGVYWDMQDTAIEDIERIEVIRGPGGTLWGANAVNGVINIITRSASETKGGLVSAVIGDEQSGATLRYGGKLANGADYRVYGKFFGRDEGYSSAGAHDDWELGQAGFRSDWQPDNDNSFTLQGDFYSGTAGQQVTVATDPANTLVTSNDDVDLEGANLLFRWQRQLDNGSDFALQVYYDYVSRDGKVLFEDRETIDVDFQHHFSWQSRHDVVWGLGYRRISDDTNNNANFALNPDDREVDLFSAFAQDEITLRENELFLTIGSKFEHNDFTGGEVQPSVRLAWTPDRNQTIWGAVSRAVRTPARGEHDVRLRVAPMGPAPPVPLIVTGDEDFESEELIAYEAGYRIRASESLSIDTAVFYNKYDNLRTFDPGTFPPPELLFPFDNNMDGDSYGVEITAQWQVRPDWRIQGAYTYLNMSLDLNSGSGDIISEAAEDASPDHQASIWSAWDLGTRWELGTGLRYVGSIDAPSIGADSYVEMDVRIGWIPIPDIDISLVGKNLLDNHHSEFQPDFIQTQPTEVERSFFANVKWRF